MRGCATLRGAPPAVVSKIHFVLHMSKRSATITIRLSVDLLERVDASCNGNRNKYIVEAVKEKLNPVKADAFELTEREQRQVVKDAKSLADVMQDLILQETSRRRNFLESMTDEDFAKLVASRLPKEQQSDGDLEANVLSLR